MSVEEAALPFNVSEPATGVVVISAAEKALAGLLSVSVNPKSAVVKARALFSLVVTVLSEPSGASFTLVTLKKRCWAWT